MCGLRKMCVGFFFGGVGISQSVSQSLCGMVWNDRLELLLVVRITFRIFLKSEIFKSTSGVGWDCEKLCLCMYSASRER